MRGWGVVPLLLAESQLRDLQDYLSAVQSFVGQEQKAFIKRVEETIAAEGLQGDEKDEFYSIHENGFDRLHNTFPRIVYASALMTACSFFESSLVDLCKAFDRDAALTKPKPWEDLNDKHKGVRGLISCCPRLRWGRDQLNDKHKGVRRADRFLGANFGIHLHKYSHWESIIDYYTIRNCLAHANGDVSIMPVKAGEKVRQVVQRHLPDISITQDGRLNLDFKFISTVIDHLAALWKELHSACRENATLGPRYWE
jgi:hypothetical protein